MRFVTFGEYEAAIINIKKLIKNAVAVGTVGLGRHILLDGDIHPDTVGPTGLADLGAGLVVSGPIADGDIPIVQGDGGGPKWARLPAGRDDTILTMTDFTETTGHSLPSWRHKITISDAAPSGGEDGDIWFEY